MQVNDEAQGYGRALMVTICDLKNEHKHGRYNRKDCEVVANCDRLVAVDNIEPLIKVIRGQQALLSGEIFSDKVLTV